MNLEFEWHVTFSGCNSTVTEYVQRCTGPTRSGSCILRCSMRWCCCLTLCNLVQYFWDILSVAWKDDRISKCHTCAKNTRLPETNQRMCLSPDFQGSERVAQCWPTSTNPCDWSRWFLRHLFSVSAHVRNRNHNASYPQRTKQCNRQHNGIQNGIAIPNQMQSTKPGKETRVIETVISLFVAAGSARIGVTAPRPNTSIRLT